MTALLDEKVLVLNKNWAPVNIIPAFKAISKVVSERAQIINPETYQKHEFDDWIMDWEDAVTYAKEHEKQVVKCQRFSFILPEVIILTGYQGYHVNRVKLSRRNIFERDNYTCQYCARKLPTKLLNIDHIMPKSRGGKTEWTNVVISCIKCNQNKADKTPEEAGIKLIRQPYRPKWLAIKGKLGKKVPKSWEDLIGKMYWEIKLEPDD